MSVLFPDTSKEAEEVLIRLLREMPAWRKLDMVWQMNATVKALMLAGLRDRHPGDSPELIQRRLADLLLGPELAARVYGPMVEGNDAI